MKHKVPLAACSLLAMLLVAAATTAQESSAEVDATVGPLQAHEAEDPLTPEGGGLVSLRVTGSALRPRVSADGTQVNVNGSCIYNASGSAFGVLNAPIYLPQGALVDTLRMYYFDTSASDSSGWFTIYDLFGGIVDEFLVASTGNSGNSFNDSAQINHTVDYSLYSYLLNWRPAVAGSTMQLCGFRVFYTPPDVFADGFESGDTSRWSTSVP